MKTFLLFVLACAIAAGPTQAQSPSSSPAPIPRDYYTFQKVVYQNDGGWPDNKTYFQRLLRNIGAHIAATDGRVEVRVVNFASGVMLFQLAKTDADLASALDMLKAKGVKFLICRNTLIGTGLYVEDLYGVKDEDVVPSGVAEIARLQGQGYVYIHP